MNTFLKLIVNLHHFCSEKKILEALKTLDYSISEHVHLQARKTTTKPTAAAQTTTTTTKKEKNKAKKNPPKKKKQTKPQ